MRELRRATWRRNQVLFRRLDEVIGVLDEAGVATMALKGIPLALEHYGDPSLRPMADIDLLVTPDTVLGGRGTRSQDGRRPSRCRPMWWPGP
jgi:hypothetical protein